MNLDSEVLEKRTLVCSPYEGVFGREAFRQFHEVYKWAETEEINQDARGRPVAFGIHLAPPRQVASGTSRYLACVGVPDDTKVDPTNGNDTLVVSCEEKLFR